MVSEWSECKVAEIAAQIKNAIVGGPFGSNLVSKDYVPSGVPVIRGQNMGQGRWVSGDYVFVSNEKATRLAQNKARPGDIVFTQRGTLGQVAIVPSTPYDEYIVSQSQMKITVNPDKADNIFIYYYFTNPTQQDYIKQNAIQTGVPHTNLEHLKKTPLVLPSLREQKVIASILSSLDNKIELNQQMNEGLESIAKTLFRSWFVDFDPVRAKSEGRQPEGLGPDIAELFPREFEESGLGEIPKGWTVKPLDKIADYLNGLALQKFPPTGEDYLPVIKIAELRQGVTEKSGKASVDIDSRYIIDDGDIIFSWSGSLVVTAWCGGKGALNQHLFKVTSKDYPKWFYHQWTCHYLPEFQRIASSKATTMGHIQRHHLTQSLVLVPQPKLLEAMSEIMEPLLEKYIQNNLQSRTLTQLRDTLLPKLMSGELPVKDVEAWAEGCI